MENYKLKADEVVFYKGEVTLKGKSGNTELMLTNLNVVLINKYKKMFSPEEVTVLKYPTNSIKMWEGVPQIKHKGTKVEIYFTKGELEVDFPSWIEVNKFVNEANKFLTGESIAHKNVQKGASIVKEGIAIVDDTLGIDSVHATGDIIKNGVTGGLTKALGSIGKNLFKKK